QSPLTSRALPEPPRPVVPDDRRIRRILECLEAAREGERNNLTHWAACRFAEMLGPQLSYEEAHALIVAAAMRAGLSHRQADNTPPPGRGGCVGPPEGLTPSPAPPTPPAVRSPISSSMRPGAPPLHARLRICLLTSRSRASSLASMARRSLSL